ncbi:chemotaxis protein MotB [Pseudochelatococcus lubricantis]|uniref:Chemotaxis protein MotB n=1 Tax=Pseudochelatococcus lubricantis TaxID=1538102 RepID=A0ABX0UYD8_9HYPH|nr:flagellar motor protein MotB [Pseudochelatococcus lubricantis]NIJ56889.1 chemotaxis protein MotB [Pseudochelatococcus lubricantis]
MDKLEHEPILIQRRHHEEEEHGAHGIWKIAYADFMTALMAFFLIMWLLNSTSRDQQASVANYFNPIKLADVSPTRKGVQEPLETVRDPKEAGKAPGPTREENASKGASEKMSGDAAHPAKPRYPESALFVDPYAILAKLAADDKPAAKPARQPAEAATEQAGAPTPRTPTIRDPFDPSYWRLAPQGQPAAISQDGQPQAGASGGTERQTSNAATGEATTGQAATAPGIIEAPQEERAREAAALRKGVADALKDESPAPGAPEIKVERTDEGILISLTDAEKFSMFSMGSAEPNPAVVRAIARIAAALAGRPGTVVIRGHTDSLPFRSDTYDNWRLSSARAHMASYMLIRGGLKEERIERIEGHADRLPRNAANTRAPENRRIEILLREKGS